MELLKQELEVWYIIPAIRKELAVGLLNNNLKQKDVAKIMNVTESAVSQYLKSKRAKLVNFDDDVKSIIYSSANAVLKNPLTINCEIQKILVKLRDMGVLCDYHKKLGNTSCFCKGCHACK
jgi:predicted transcriptional regulator